MKLVAVWAFNLLVCAGAMWFVLWPVRQVWKSDNDNRETNRWQ